MKGKASRHISKLVPFQKLLQGSFHRGKVIVVDALIEDGPYWRLR
jgi:hypothetical protein